MTIIILMHLSILFPTFSFHRGLSEMNVAIVMIITVWEYIMNL